MKAFAIRNYVGSSDDPISSCCQARAIINPSVKVINYHEDTPKHLHEQYYHHSQNTFRNHIEDGWFICSACGKELLLMSGKAQVRHITDHEYMRIGDLKDTNMMVRAGHLNTYYFLAQNKTEVGWHVAALDMEHRLTYNAAKGDLYALDMRGKHKNVSSPTKGTRIKNITYQANNLFEVLKSPEKKEEFVDMCVKNRRRYINSKLQPCVDEAIKAAGGTRNGTRKFEELFLLLKFPPLVNMPANLVFHPYEGRRLNPDKDFRNLISTETSGNKLFNKLFSVGDYGRNMIKYVADASRDPYDVYTTAMIGSKMFPTEWVLELLYNEIRISFSEPALCISTQQYKWFNNFAKEYGRKRLFNHCMDEEYKRVHLLEDSVVMYNKLKRADKNYTIHRTSTVRRVHDVLAKDFRKLELERKDFKYSEEVKDIQGTYKDYDFQLPESNLALSDIGQDLQNCVGSYQDRVINNTCVIIAGMKDGENAICVEIRDNRLVQAKLKHNRSVAAAIDLDPHKAVVEFCKDNKIDYKDSMDMDVNRYKEIAERAQQRQNIPAPALDLQAPQVAGVQQDEVPF